MMANSANPLPYLLKRETGLLANLKPELFTKRLEVAKNLYRRDLVCHFGCVNAIEFSSNGELLVSGGDDRRVVLWQFGQTMLGYGKPEPMESVHMSNIFCLSITDSGQRIFSGGNDDVVIIHDTETKRALEALQHARAVCSLSIDPFNDRVVATAGNDGRLLIFDTRDSVHETLEVARSRKAFHGVMYHPTQRDLMVAANARDGVALWDLRVPRQPVVRYVGKNSSCQNSMSVRFNATGSHIFALRRRLSPVLYETHSPEPVAEFYHQDYYNTCTMKSCCFAGERDQFVVSGSDDFNLYVWKVPDWGGNATDTKTAVVEPPAMILYGHRSIVNQVRYNRNYCLLASSGVEKIIKTWSAMEYPEMRGALLEEAQGSDNPRELYSHEDYISLVHHSGQHISHNYAEQSTREDPRMMAFFDNLVQREQECQAETDCSETADGEDSDHTAHEFVTLPSKRADPNGNRSQRCPNRLARLVPSRYSKNLRSQKRGSLRRSKDWRAVSKSSGHGHSSCKGKRGPVRRARGPRRPTLRAVLPTVRPQTYRRLAAPSTDVDSDEPAPNVYRNSNRMIRPLRRRNNLTRSSKRRSKGTSYRKLMHLRSNGAPIDSSDNNQNSYDMFDDNLAQPSTSSGYRGENTSAALFRIAEVDSDDDQSLGSRPMSPRANIPQSLVSIIPTPLNGSRDSLGDSLRVEPESERSSPPPDRTRVRRSKRNGRLSIQMSDDSSESPPPKESKSAIEERLSPIPSYNRTVARLMNETNESELESSCSTESSLWPAPDTVCTPDSGVGTAAGSSTRTRPPADDVSDDQEYQTVKFRQRVKKARRNYRKHLDSDSN